MGLDDLIRRNSSTPFERIDVLREACVQEGVRMQ